MTYLSRIAFILLVSLSAVQARAQADPPARVGRLAVVENAVNFRVDQDDQGGPATINWPISSGAMLDSERHGRAEIWVGSSAFRLAANSHLEFPVVDDRQVMLKLLGGTLAVSILERDQSADITVDTPDGRVSFASPGRYRIDVLADHTELTAQAGRAIFNDGERDVAVAAGQKARIYGGSQVRVGPDTDQDAFDYWVAERENAALASSSQRYVSPAMTGYQDLDRYGDWNATAEYGAVWYPRAVDDDWAPYRFGRWVWVAPWGWTWIDQSPWGFAPFHYGRWVQVRNRWGWVPGSHAARPVYAPALVAWIGNPGWSVGFRSGAAPAVGWFPLAPREVYVPGFRASNDYVHRINGSHVRNNADIDRAMRAGANQTYVNRTLPQAVTVVPSSLLREGRPIARGDIGRQDRHELERAPQARPAPEQILPPPANGRSFRDAQRDQPGMRGREPDGRMIQRDQASPRLVPGISDQRPRDAVPAPLPNREEMRRGGFAREPAGTPREVLPGRQPERSEPDRRPITGPAPVIREEEAVRRAPPAVAPPQTERSTPVIRQGNEFRQEGRLPERSEPERRPAAVPAPVIVPPAQIERPMPVIRQNNEVREERRMPAMPAVREMPRDDREFQRREMPRPAEVQPAPRPQAAPQFVPPPAPPPVQRAPMPQAAPAPAPAPVQQRPPEQHRDADKDQRRRDHGDEHGQR